MFLVYFQEPEMVTIVQNLTILLGPKTQAQQLRLNPMRDRKQTGTKTEETEIVIQTFLTILTLFKPEMGQLTTDRQTLPHKNKPCPKIQLWLYSIKNPLDLQRSQLMPFPVGVGFRSTRNNSNFPPI